MTRYELADYEWAAIKPMLSNKARGGPRVNDRRVLNGIFWVLRSGALARFAQRCSILRSFPRKRESSAMSESIECPALGPRFRGDERIARLP
jgi:transposase